MKSEILPAVAAIIFNAQGDVLLQMRKDRNKWGIISGHVEFGESISEAIIREIKEETNVDAKIIRFIGIYSLPMYQTYEYPDRTAQYVTAYFEAVLSGSIPANFSNDETQELKYFSLEELPLSMDTINPHWLKDALSKNASAFVR